MVAATIPRARMRDLACLGRGRPTDAGPSRRRPVVRFAPSAAHRYFRYRRAPAAAPQTGQLTPRDRRPRGPNHLADRRRVAVREPDERHAVEPVDDADAAVVLLQAEDRLVRHLEAGGEDRPHDTAV